MRYRYVDTKKIDDYVRSREDYKQGSHPEARYVLGAPEGDSTGVSSSIGAIFFSVLGGIMIVVGVLTVVLSLGNKDVPALLGWFAIFLGICMAYFLHKFSSYVGNYFLEYQNAFYEDHVEVCRYKKLKKEYYYTDIEKEIIKKGISVKKGAIRIPVPDGVLDIAATVEINASFYIFLRKKLNDHFPVIGEYRQKLIRETGLIRGIERFDLILLIGFIVIELIVFVCDGLIGQDWNECYRNMIQLCSLSNFCVYYIASSFIFWIYSFYMRVKVKMELKKDSDQRRVKNKISYFLIGLFIFWIVSYFIFMMIAAYYHIQIGIVNM